MVKTPYIIALCTLVIAGCQKEDLVKQGNGDGTVRYAVAMNQTVRTRAVDNGTVASGNVVSLKDRSGRLSIPMSSEVTEGILCASSTAVAQDATKGTLVNTSGSPQALSGFATAVGGVFAAKAYVGATEQLSQTVTWNSLTSAWVGSPVAYWPQSTSLNFLACANIAAEDVDFASTGLTMDHTVPATAAAQTDILFGHYQGNGGNTGTAQIRFEHPLTAVRFLYGEIDGNLHIKSISLDGVAASGTAAMNVEGAITWSGVSDYSHIVSQINASGLPRTTLSGHTAQLIGESFIIIPQSLSAHEVTVTVTLSDGTVLEATLSADEWKAGCTNTYTLGYTNPSQVHFVDLGLPSGILWADKNVGATSVTDMGDHYPWGETEEWYSSLSASYDYTMKPKYSGGFTVANYNSLSNMKSINANLTGAYEQYDVAAATYGDGCRMPSNTEFDELKANCYWRTVTSYGGASVKGVVAFKVQDSSHKGKCNQSYDSSYNYDMPHIFIPDNGYGQNEVLRSGTIGSGPKGVNAGYYWLSNYTAHSFSFSSNLPSRLEDDSKRPRYLALGVRPVKKFVKSHEYVEIGGLKWATCNLGANTPKDYGWYFSWAGTTGYVRDGSKWVTAQGGSELSGGFCWAKAPYNTAGVQTSWNKYIPTGQTGYWSGGGSPDNKLSLELDDDAVRANLGGSWRMPTQADFQTLYEACGGTNPSSGIKPTTLSSSDPGKGIYWVKADQTYISDYAGVAGLLFCDGISKLFFVAAGYGVDGNFNDEGFSGRYWSGSVYSNPPCNAYYMAFISDKVKPDDANARKQGFPVRPVSD